MNIATRKEVTVSVVIVCMDNLKNLIPCLDSIVFQTRENNYEIFVVAYLFSDRNLDILKSRFPDVIIIESNEIRGFSENNNLALRQARGKYCFVLNDDTVMEMPVIDLLVESFGKEPGADFMSPKIVFADGRTQRCGRPIINIRTYFLTAIRLWHEQQIKSKYINQRGIFQTYNIVGAAFMVKTSVIRNLGYFDETYFFSPEDIALSTLANRKGYKCYVNESVVIIHHEGTTAKIIKGATEAAALKGMIIFLGSNGLKKILISGIIFLELTCKAICWVLNFTSKNQKNNLKKKADSFKVLFSRKTPKQLFIERYH